MKMPAYVWDRMVAAKQQAIDLDDRRNTPLDFSFGDFNFQILPNGAAGGKEFVLISPDIRMEFASRNRSFAVSWRATAAGLWEHGLDRLVDQVFFILEKEGFRPNQKYWRKLSRADYAFDIEAASFTNEMIPEIVHQIICPKEAKARGDFFARSGRVETLTVGSKRGLQVQIYDKGLEITEMSGKTWMTDIWMNNGYSPETDKNGKEVHKNVWRLEVRMAGNWLKSRSKKTDDGVMNMKDPDHFIANMWSLITEGLYSRRLTSRSETDSNRRRWPLHPLYALAAAACGHQTAFVPVGYHPTEKSKKLQDMLIANIAGTLRSLAVLRLRGALDEDDVFNMAEVDTAINEARATLTADREHHRKIKKARERYEFVDNAK